MKKEEIIKNLKLIQKQFHKYDFTESLRLAMMAVEESPEWIPITTRALTDEESEKYDDSVTHIWTCHVPEVGQDVLVTTSWGGVQIVAFTDGGDIGTYFDEMDTGDVIAWMPLPDPYEKENT